MIVLSGGQTGVDRAAWDSAKDAGLESDGWVPKGRLAEDGFIPPRYSCRETEGSRYTERTERNVIDADATLVLGFGPAGGGTAFTLECCRRHSKPHVFLDLDRGDLGETLASALLFLRGVRPAKLNVAGPRGSYRPDVYQRARAFLVELFAAFIRDGG